MTEELFNPIPAEWGICIEISIEVVGFVEMVNSASRAHQALNLRVVFLQPDKAPQKSVYLGARIAKDLHLHRSVTLLRNFRLHQKHQTHCFLQRHQAESQSICTTSTIVPSVPDAVSQMSLATGI